MSETIYTHHYTEPELVRQGLEWLKLHRNELTELYTYKLATIPHSYYSDLPTEQCRQMATKSLSQLVERLEGNVFDGNEVKKYFVGMLERGMRLQDLTLATDKLLALFAFRVQYDLESQPLVREALLKKINYIFQFLKTTMAVAVIQYESQRSLIKN